MPVQTVVEQFQRPGAPGLVANAETRNLISRSLYGATPAPFGAPVYRAPANRDEQCSAVAADGDFLGLARRSGVINPANAGDRYVTNDEVPVMTLGVMWVTTGAAVTQGVPAGYNPATNLWAPVAGAYVAVPGAEFDSGNDAAGLAKVRLNRVTPA